MLQNNNAIISAIIATMMVGSIGFAYAESKPSKQMEQFLGFDRKTQDGFISTSVTMLAVIAAQTAPEIAKCVDNWYSVSTENAQMRNSEFLAVMRENQQYKPTAIVLAVVERECGKFERKP